MKTFTIDAENKNTVHTSRKAAKDTGFLRRHFSRIARVGHELLNGPDLNLKSVRRFNYVAR